MAVIFCYLQGAKSRSLSKKTTSDVYIYSPTRGIHFRRMLNWRALVDFRLPQLLTETGRVMFLAVVIVWRCRQYYRLSSVCAGVHMKSPCRDRRTTTISGRTHQPPSTLQGDLACGMLSPHSTPWHRRLLGSVIAATTSWPPPNYFFHPQLKRLASLSS